MSKTPLQVLLKRNQTGQYYSFLMNEPRLCVSPEKMSQSCTKQYKLVCVHLFQADVPL